MCVIVVAVVVATAAAVLCSWFAKWGRWAQIFSQIRWYSHANLCFRWCILSVDCVFASPYLCCYCSFSESTLLVCRSVGGSHTLSFARTLARLVARLSFASFVFWLCVFSQSWTAMLLVLVLALLLIFVGGNLGNLYAGSQFTVSYVRHLKSKNHDFSFISNSSILVSYFWSGYYCGCFLFSYCCSWFDVRWLSGREFFSTNTHTYIDIICSMYAVWYSTQCHTR